ncbi:hypothetical protein MHOCP_08320 [Moorella humiferrea]|uniref:tetratricopeptide repeat protein n=1 Tax=Neomoorella humiferrea TaxID=676965 RepID=UPI0030CA6815
MGMMSSLRRLGKKRPVFGILFVVVLSIGLIGSYAIFAAPRGAATVPSAQDAASGSDQQAEDLQKAAQEQINQLQAQINNLQRELQSRPDDKDLLLQLGDTQYSLGTMYLFTGGDPAKAGESFKAAVSNYQQVVKLNPQEKGIYLRLAGAALYAGDDKLAEENFQAAVKADPTDNNARLSYGMYLASIKGDFQGAVNQWQEILKNNPDKELADQVQEMIKQAEAARQQQQQQAGGGEGSQPSDQAPQSQQ